MSADALPKVAVPAGKPHEHREFRLPAGVVGSDGAPDLAQLRARALGLGTQPPPLPTPDPAVQVVSPPPPVAAKALAPVAKPRALPERSWPTIATPAPEILATKAPAAPEPKPLEAAKAALEAGWSQPVAAGAPNPKTDKPPMPAPPILPPPLAAKGPPTPPPPPGAKAAAKTPPRPIAALPPPLPPPPVLVAPPPARALIVDSASRHGERTNMWFKIGDELATERSSDSTGLTESPPQAPVATARFWTATTVLAVAGGGLGLFLLILFV